MNASVFKSLVSPSDGVAGARAAHRVGDCRYHYDDLDSESSRSRGSYAASDDRGIARQPANSIVPPAE